MAWEFQHRGAAWITTTTASTAVSGMLDGSMGREWGAVLVAPQEDRDDSFGTVLGRFDRQSRIHSVDGQPGLEYSDGRKEWYWHGVRVPVHVVCEPHLITAQEIDAETNAEARRVMIERYPGGAVALMQAQGAVVKHKDEFGELWVRNFRTALSGGFADIDPLVMLKVKNSSPEPDGSFRDYWLRVPPTCRTAREAVAWTFGMTEKQYQPELET